MQTQEPARRPRVMADRPSTNDQETAVGRWSRRKHEAQESLNESPESEAQETPADRDQEKQIKDQEDVVASLPPIDSLPAESDFTPFLDRAVPAELRKLALRKLWLSDPVFANLDGLNDYDDDFRTLGVGKLVRTAYQVGRHLKFDPVSEKVVGDEEADTLLNKPEYREPYVVPKEV